MGRPEHKTTKENRDTVKHCAVQGFTHEQTARVLGISALTLTKYYRDELDNGADQTKSFVVGCLMKKIKKGDIAAIIFYLKTKGRWKEGDNNEPLGKPFVFGAPNTPLEGVDKNE